LRSYAPGFIIGIKYFLMDAPYEYSATTSKFSEIAVLEKKVCKNLKLENLGFYGSNSGLSSR
jgi:hypothetical protein